jgi:hypothetical protein
MVFRIAHAPAGSVLQQQRGHQFMLANSRYVKGAP